MVSFVDALKSAAKTAVCGALGNANKAANLLYPLYGKNALAVQLKNLADFHRSQLCDKPAPTPFAYPNNGQSPCGYNVHFYYTVSGSTTPSYNGNFDFNFQFWGPIGACGYGPITGTGNGRQQGFTVDCHGSYLGAYGGQQVVTTIGTSLGVNGVLNITDVQVSLIGGQNSSCANEPDGPPVVPVDWNQYPTNITYNDGDNNNYTLPLTVVFAPFFLDANANITVPLTFKISPTLNFNGTLKLGDGTFNINFGNPGNNPPVGFPPASPNPNGSGGDYSNYVINNKLDTIINNTQEPCDLTPVLNSIQSFRDSFDVFKADSFDIFAWFRDALLTFDNTELVYESPDGILKQGTFTDLSSVTFLALSSKPYAVVLIDISDDYPPGLRFYKLDDDPSKIEAGFGNAAVCINNSSGVYYATIGLQIISTRYTAVMLPRGVEDLSLRLSLKPGITYRVLDIGARYKKTALATYPSPS